MNNISLENHLIQLYHQQLDADVIQKTVHEDIHKLTPIIHNNTLQFYIQHNPHRLTRGLSENPNPKPKHIIQYKGGIPCFLCMDNIQVQWPKERGYHCKIDGTPFIFLPNPYPIFPLHFTVASKTHLPQLMNIPTLITIAKKLPQHWVIQNGPDAGATNPEHFHYQTFLPSNLPSNLPITHYQSIPIIQKNTIQISRLIHPATLYKCKFKTSEEGQKITTLLMEYLTQNLQHRLNILCTYTPTTRQWTLLALLRHTLHQTPLYQSGQPGYAEAAGMISSTSPEHHRDWLQNSISRYTQLMSDIACPKQSETHFQTLIHSILSK